MVTKIDVHTHAIPDFFLKILHSVSQNASGVPRVEWSMDGTIDMMAKLDIATSILSLSAPGPEIVADMEDARALAKQFNECGQQARQFSLGILCRRSRLV